MFAPGGANTASWQFSDTIATLTLTSQFKVSGASPIGAVISAPDTVDCTYASANFGDPWSVATSAGITFTGGGTLAVPESGNID